jgi:hypothetical protein
LGAARDALHPQPAFKKPHAFLLVAVFTSPRYRRLRDAVRETWARLGTASANETAVVRFVIGRTGDAAIDAAVRKESQEQGDIAMLPMRESYEALTTKTLETMRWAAREWSFDYLLKTDDDSFVRLDRIVRLLRAQPRSGLYMGGFHTRSPVVRDKSSKHYDREMLLSGRSVLPDFAGGGAGYVLSADLIRWLSASPVPLRAFLGEDVSVSVWLSALRSYAVDHPGFLWRLPEARQLSATTFTALCTSSALSTHFWEVPKGQVRLLHHLYFKNLREARGDHCAGAGALQFPLFPSDVGAREQDMSEVDRAADAKDIFTWSMIPRRTRDRVRALYDSRGFVDPLGGGGGSNSTASPRPSRPVIDDKERERQRLRRTTNEFIKSLRGSSSSSIIRE